MTEQLAHLVETPCRDARLVDSLLASGSSHA